jgi:hypothetical protein
VGGFEKRFGVGGEEQVLALDMLREGWQLAYVDGIVAHHHPSKVRDADKRRRHEVRNFLWSAWLRRPAGSAWTATRRIFITSLRDRARLAGIFDALKGVSWVLSDRKPIPSVIDRQLQVAEEAWISGSGQG